MEKSALEEKILASLNEKQRQAVTSPSSGILQIVAGPGTGKTKVIVSRVAYLLLHEGISPQHLVVTTFTKKAAKEMMERLRVLFSGTDIAVGKLLVGTFHSICYKIIQKYGHLIGLEGVSIADEKDSQQILENVLLTKITAEQWTLIDALPTAKTMPYHARHGSKEKFRGYDVKSLKRLISKAKCGALFPDQYDTLKGQNALVSVVYRAYHDELFANKVLDFDDCLLYCHKIITQFPVLKLIEHTLVDEFQDTNEIQLQLMYHFARGHPSNRDLQSNVTIVGDPDQSIYAFRDAQSANFEKMRDHYALAKSQHCEVITLNESYRSTSDILHISETVMRQQSGRVLKNLVSQYTKSFKPVQVVLSSNEEEAKWITHQIEFLAGLPQEVFSYSDMAILVRSAFQTRTIENELVKRQIPYFMVRGKAFWDRKEVVAMVDYLRCVANNNDKLALLRCVNFPNRGLGPKKMADLDLLIDKQRAANARLSAFETLKRVASADLKSTLGPKMRTALKLFLLLIEEAIAALTSQHDPAHPKKTGGMATAFDTLYKDSGIKVEFSESTDCDLNVQEIKAQLLAFEPPPDVSLPDCDEIEPQDTTDEPVTGPLFVRKFLELISLYETDPGETEDQQQKPKVSISTIHGSKGLEWPVVFVPGVSEGLLPASFAINESVPETINEERRCFYVATSRAQALLFISAYVELDGGDSWRRMIDSTSRFMEKVRGHCDTTLQLSTTTDLNTLYELRGLSFSEKGFDVKAYWKKYNQKMRKSIKQGKRCADYLFDGFTTAANLDTDLDFAAKTSTANTVTGINSLNNPFAPKKTEAFKAPTYVVDRRISSLEPTFILDDGLDEALNTDVKVPTIGATNGSVARVKRAPTYVPVRTGSKKRLGTK